MAVPVSGHDDAERLGDLFICQQLEIQLLRADNHQLRQRLNLIAESDDLIDRLSEPTDDNEPEPKFLTPLETCQPLNVLTADEGWPAAIVRPFWGW